MKLLLLTTISLVCICLCQAGVYVGHYYRNSKHPGKCVIEDQVVEPGQSIKHPGIDCAEFTCDNSIGLATVETCDSVSALATPLNNLKDYDRTNPPKCTWGDFRNTKASFPKCCERHFICVF